MNNKTTAFKDTVLIVDDTAANHDVIRAFLNDINVSCESAYDGMEAVTACNDIDEAHYSLILMDINLPHMNGVQTTRKLRDMGITSPIMAVTAASGDELKTGNAHAVFDAVLYKPFNSAKFFAAIAPYIRNAAGFHLNSQGAAQPDSHSPVNADEMSILIDSQVCDVSRGIANMGNSPRLFTKHLNNFKKNNADLVMRITALLDSGDYEECAKLCHSIKGLSGMLGLTALYQHFIEMEAFIERIIREDITEDEVNLQLSHINNAIRLVCRLPI